MSHTTSYGFLAPCQNLEISNDIYNSKKTARGKDRQKDEQKDRRAEGRTDPFHKIPAIAGGPKRDHVSKIEKLKRKAVVGNNIKNLCDQVSRLLENLAQLMDSNEKLSSQCIVIVMKNVNTHQ